MRAAGVRVWVCLAVARWQTLPTPAIVCKLNKHNGSMGFFDGALPPARLLAGICSSSTVLFNSSSLKVLARECVFVCGCVYNK